MATGIMAPPTTNNTQANAGPYVSKWANRYRGVSHEKPKTSPDQLLPPTTHSNGLTMD